MFDRELLKETQKLLYTMSQSARYIEPEKFKAMEKNIADLLAQYDAQLDSIDKLKTSTLVYSDALLYHSCNYCGRKGCEHRPELGKQVRSNCILFVAKEENNGMPVQNQSEG